MLYKNRSIFDKYGMRIGNALKGTGVTANQWTGLSILFAFITFYFLVNQSFLLAALLFALTAVFDAFDGAVARATGKASKVGAYLATVADRYAEFIVIAGILFASIPPYYVQASFWLLLYLFGSATTTYVKAAAKEKELTKMEIKGGVLERPERMILLFLGIFLASFSKIYLTYVIIVLAVLSNITALQRVRIALESGKAK